jgi:hypothetical protein
MSVHHDVQLRGSLGFNDVDNHWWLSFWFELVLCESFDSEFLDVIINDLGSIPGMGVCVEVFIE